MIKILFICHGNICRSPLAEMLMRDMIAKAGLSGQISVASAATSREEIGNPVHHGTVEKLRQYGIGVGDKRAVQLTKRDYTDYDYLIGMDDWNIRNIQRIIGSDPKQKVHKLLEYAGLSGDIADPWYTGNFDKTYEDIKAGCDGLLKLLTEEIADGADGKRTR